MSGNQLKISKICKKKKNKTKVTFRIKSLKKTQLIFDDNCEASCYLIFLIYYQQFKFHLFFVFDQAKVFRLNIKNNNIFS